MPTNITIRGRRLALGLTEQQLADKVGVTRAAVQQWEREGGTAPRRSKNEAVAEALGISVAELLGITVATPPLAYSTGGASIQHTAKDVSGGYVTSEAAVFRALQVLAARLNALPNDAREMAAQYMQTLARAPDSTKALHALEMALVGHQSKFP